MKKIIFLLIFIGSFAFSAIDECKTDVYFGNGIMTSPSQAQHAAYVTLQLAVKSLYSTEEEMKKHIGKFDYAYNSTHLGGLNDLMESLLQKTNLADRIDALSELNEALKKTAHETDLELQIQKYKGSIREGHKVLVVAHSQGNLFAYEAFRKLPEWMQDYWEAVGVASPGMFEIKEDAPSIAWDNDLVADMALNPFRPRVRCNVRRVSWEVVSGGSDTRPNEIYLYKKNVGRKYGSFRSNEGVLEQFDFNVHSFSFYMGEHLTGLISGKEYKDIFEDAYLTDIAAKTLIMTAIKTQLDNLEKLPSQWTPKNKGCLCKEKYVEMTHISKDPKMDALLRGQHVKDFAEGTAGKIYTASGKYVRATCGGTKIEPVTTEEGVCYALTNKERIRAEIIGLKIEMV